MQTRARELAAASDGPKRRGESETRVSAGNSRPGWMFRRAGKNCVPERDCPIRILLTVKVVELNPCCHDLASASPRCSGYAPIFDVPQAPDAGQLAVSPEDARSVSSDHADQL